MNTPLLQKRWMLTLLAVTAVFAGAAFAQNSPNQNIVRIKDTGTPSVQSINAKLDRLIQQQGGRYVFLSSADGDLWRLDTFTGKVAVLNLVRGAEWDTLDVPEKSVGPGNAFYEQYVQKLNGINFNSN